MESDEVIWVNGRSRGFAASVLSQKRRPKTIRTIAPTAETAIRQRIQREGPVSRQALPVWGSEVTTDRFCTRRRFREVEPFYRRDEPVSAFCQSLDVARILRRVAQGLADLIDRCAQAVVEVNYRFRAPYLLLQFLPGNDFSCVAQEDGQQLERLALELDADSALPQLTGSKVGFKYAKPDSAQMGGDLFEHGTSTEYHNRESFRKICSGCCHGPLTLFI